MPYPTDYAILFAQVEKARQSADAPHTAQTGQNEVKKDRPMDENKYAIRTLAKHLDLTEGEHIADIHAAVDEIVSTAVRKADMNATDALSRASIRFSQHIDRLERQIKTLEARIAQLEGQKGTEQ